ncbi:hypothetical protein OIU76_002888 [Salix suchowensis]|nr:hypothetical protein OIU76_002888 [Salix suchowensis]
MFIAGKLEVAKGLFSKLSAAGIQPTGRTYNVMIRGLLKVGLPDEAYELLRKWKMMKHNKNEVVIYSSPCSLSLSLHVSKIGVSVVTKCLCLRYYQQPGIFTTKMYLLCQVQRSIY